LKPRGRRLTSTVDWLLGEDSEAILEEVAVESKGLYPRTRGREWLASGWSLVPVGVSVCQVLVVMASGVMNAVVLWGAGNLHCQ